MGKKLYLPYFTNLLQDPYIYFQSETLCSIQLCRLFRLLMYSMTVSFIPVFEKTFRPTARDA